MIKNNPLFSCTEKDIMAAAASPLQNLLEEASCPICLGPFKDPVITPCGHNFCRPCITGCFGEPGAPLCCPQCRAPCCLAELKPNRQLQSMVELVTQLAEVQQEKPPQGGGVCVQHEEKLKLFCQDDDKLLCVVCQVSREHERHRVRPINEAAQDYQDRLQHWVVPLKKERDAIVTTKEDEEEKYNAMRKQLEAGRMKSAADFEHLRQLLRDQEQRTLKSLEEMDRKITMMENANISKLSIQISYLDALIEEIETKQKQSPVELLKDVGLTLSRCINVRFREQERKIKKEEQMDNIMQTTDLQAYDLPEETEDLFISGLFLDTVHVKRHKVSVTLDPGTASQSLVLFENERRVRNVLQYSSASPQLFWPNNPRRFTASSCVLGKQCFYSGKHYWDVQIVKEDLGWTVGVAQESVNREFVTMMPQKKDLFSLFSPRRNSDRIGLVFPETPDKGVWAVHGAQGQYFALKTYSITLKPSQPPKKLGVYLDYEAGQVSLYNGDTMEVLYTFKRASFNGPVHPYFNLCSNNDAGRKRKGTTDLRLV